MSPVSHFFAGWMLASVFPAGRPTTLTRREKALVVAAAVAPDLDGIGIVPELLDPQHLASAAVVLAVSPFAAHSGLCAGLYPCRLPYRRSSGQLHLWPVDQRPPLAHAPMVDRIPGLCQLPPAPAVRPHRRPRPRRRPMAHPLPQAILKCRPTYLARPVGAQRLAEFCNYRSCFLRQPSGSRRSTAARRWSWCRRRGIVF